MEHFRLEQVADDAWAATVEGWDFADGHGRNVEALHA